MIRYKNLLKIIGIVVFISALYVYFFIFKKHLKIFNKPSYKSSITERIQQRFYCHKIFTHHFLFPKSFLVDAKDKLSRVGDVSSIPFIIEALKLEEKQIMPWHTTDSLQRLTNQNIGNSYKKWSEWWSKNKNKSRIQWCKQGYIDKGIKFDTDSKLDEILGIFEFCGKGTIFTFSKFICADFFITESYDQDTISEAFTVASKHKDITIRYGALRVATQMKSKHYIEMFSRDDDFGLRKEVSRNIEDIDLANCLSKNNEKFDDLPKIEIECNDKIVFVKFVNDSFIFVRFDNPRVALDICYLNEEKNKIIKSDFNFHGGLSSNVVQDADSVYFFTTNKLLHCFSNDGRKLKWQKKIKNISLDRKLFIYKEYLIANSSEFILIMDKKGNILKKFPYGKNSRYFLKDKKIIYRYKNFLSYINLATLESEVTKKKIKSILGIIKDKLLLKDNTIKDYKSKIYLYDTKDDKILRTNLIFSDSPPLSHYCSIRNVNDGFILAHEGFTYKFNSSSGKIEWDFYSYDDNYIYKKGYLLSLLAYRGLNNYLTLKSLKTGQMLKAFKGLPRKLKELGASFTVYNDQIFYNCKGKLFKLKKISLNSFYKN